MFVVFMTAEYAFCLQMDDRLLILLADTIFSLTYGGCASVNLFWSTRRLTSSREDHLTEFFAAALEASETFRNAYIEFVLRAWPQAGNLSGLKIRDIATQPCFPGTSCCPDMRLTLSDGRVIVCEHKIDALETEGPQADPRPQLLRYLDLPIDGLIYVRSSWKAPAGEVLEHAKYIRPQGREHFLWRDFHPLLAPADHILIEWLRDGFDRLGFTQPHPTIGELSGPDSAIVLPNQNNFAKMWQSTRTAARRLGWKVETGSIVELYLSNNSTANASEVFISPAGAERFLLRATPCEGRLEEVAERLSQAAASLGVRAEVFQAEVRREGGKAQVLEVVSALQEIIGSEAASPDEIEARLLAFVEPFLKSLSKNKPSPDRD